MKLMRYIYTVYMKILETNEANDIYITELFTSRHFSLTFSYSQLFTSSLCGFPYQYLRSVFSVTLPHDSEEEEERKLEHKKNPELDIGLRKSESLVHTSSTLHCSIKGIAASSMFPVQTHPQASRREPDHFLSGGSQWWMRTLVTAVKEPTVLYNYRSN